MWTTRLVILTLLLAVMPLFLASGGPSWEDRYTPLSAKITRERDKGLHGSLDQLVEWMTIKAADRDQARTLSAAAQNAGNPYWAERFAELIDDAQASANDSLQAAADRWVSTTADWMTAVARSSGAGVRVYQRAKQLGLDHARAREAVRCNVRFALGDIEYTPSRAIYTQRLYDHVLTDAGGATLPVTGDTVTSCLPRDAFRTTHEGYPSATAHKGLEAVEKIRAVATLFELFERNAATDLMNQYLKDAYCYFGAPSPFAAHGMRSLRSHVRLGEEYVLDDAKTFLLGLRGRLSGTVDVDEGGSQRPAPGAKVRVVDDDQVLTATADARGRYEIADAPISSRCSPVFIAATYRGKGVEDSYEGVLDTPSAGGKVDKDLVVPGGEWRVTGTLSIEIKEQLDCELSDKTSTSIHHEDEAYIAIVQLRAKEMNLATSPAYGSNAAGFAATGSIQARIQNFDTYTSPDTERRSTASGTAATGVTTQDVQLVIGRDLESMENKIEELGLKAGGGDKKALAELNHLLAGDLKNMNVLITATVLKQTRFPIRMTDHERHKDSEGGWRTTANDARTVDLPTFPGVALEFRGRFTSDGKGGEKIVAQTSRPEATKVYGGKCTRHVTHLGNLTLTKRPK